MKTVYCLSGLGADERIFHKLDVPGISFKYISWLQPEANESLHDYARRIIGQIDEEQPVLIGVSFGGMMAIEIARMIPVDKVILIASIKSHKELPLWMRTFGRIGAHRALPSKSLKDLRLLKLLRPLQNYFLGARNADEIKLANEFRDNVDPVYLRWSVNQVFNWKNDWLPENIYHLHGSMDHIFPLKNTHPTHIILDGGHFMIMDHHREISDIVAKIVMNGHQNG